MRSWIGPSRRPVGSGVDKREDGELTGADLGNLGDARAQVLARTEAELRQALKDRDTQANLALRLREENRLLRPAAKWRRKADRARVERTEAEREAERDWRQERAQWDP